MGQVEHIFNGGSVPASDIPGRLRAGMRGVTAKEVAPLLLLFVLPIILVASGAPWTFTRPGEIDSWVYHGYFLHLKDHLREFPGAYYGTRLTWILPGYLAHTLFPPLVANGLLRLMICWTVALSAFHLIRRNYGARCALIAALLLLSYPGFLSWAGADYVSGSAVAFLLFSFEELDATAIRVRSGAGGAFVRAAIAGAALAAAFFTHVFILVYFPIAALFFFARCGKRGFRSLIPMAVGFASLVAVLGVIDRILGGPFLFFLPQFTQAVGLATSKTNSWYSPASKWIREAIWLVVPVAVALASIPFFCRAAIGARRNPKGDPAARAADLTLLFLAIGCHTAIEAIGMPYLQCDYYTTLFTVPLGLTVAAMFGSRLEAMSHAAFRTLVAACFLLAILVATDFTSLPSRLVTRYLHQPQQALPLVIVLVAAILIGAYLRPRAVAIAALSAGVAGVLLASSVGERMSEGSSGATTYERYVGATQASRWIGQASHGGKVWFLYDADGNNNVYLTSIASTYLWGFRLLARKIEDPAGLHLGYLTEGAYVAVMHRRPEIVEQGARELMENGGGIEKVARLDQSIGSEQYHILLVKITEVASHIVTPVSEPQTLLPLRSILDDETKALVKDTYCVPFGAKKQPELSLGVFAKTDPRDHCAGQFLELSGAAAVKVTIDDHRTANRYGSVHMILQDAHYNEIYSSGTVPGKQREDIVPNAAGNTTVRIVFLPNSQGNIVYPERVELETLKTK